MTATIFFYILISISIGLYFSKRVKTGDDFIRAGRNLPFIIIFAMVFATWFGAETVLGISATFLEEGLSGLASDPFGASACLITFGIFFAKKLYRMNLLTLGDFFRKKYNRHIEFTISILIIISYLGWISAQITALGLVIFILSDGIITKELGILLGSCIVLTYTIMGGMWAIATTTFIQMVVILIGLLLVSFEIVDLAGGLTNVIAKANFDGKLHVLPSIESLDFLLWIAAFLTMALGSIPQQDVFQRANSAKNEKIASIGTTLGGVIYLVFATIPLVLAYSAFIIDPAGTSKLMEIDSQLVLPKLILLNTSDWIQILFFGSLISVILSTAAGTLLAPGVLFTQNVARYLGLELGDKNFLKATRISILLFTVMITIYAMSSNENIHKMVENAYRVTLAGAFVPLVFGMFWKKANSQGAGLAITLGIFSWLFLEFFFADLIIEPQLVGLVFSFIGMIVGSLFIEKAK